MSKAKTLVRPATKTALILKLLSRRNGADVGALQTATGWQPHSVRAALSGLRKSGYTIDRNNSEIAGGTSVYRITSAPKARQ